MEKEKPVCAFIRRRKKVITRAKEASSSSDEDIKIVRKQGRIDANPLIQKTAYFAAKRRFNEEEDDPDDAATFAFRADHNATISGPKDQGATATLEIDTDNTHDSQALFLKAQEINKNVSSNQDKVYRGLNNYAQYIEKKDTVMGNAASGFNRKGPMRAPAHLRATVRWDYQPDICKDYKETGFCSFGDSCKFLHDRSDYKHGWQLEQEFKEGTYGIDGNDDRYVIKDDSDDDADAHLPLVCLICRGDFKDPVVTKCKHYFCSACAVKRFQKTARCYACTEDTKGSFKMAKDLISRIAAIKAKQKAVAEASEEENTDEEHHRHEHNQNCHHSHEPQPSSSHNEHYIDSSELESSDDEKKKEKTSFPTLSRVEGAKPEAVEYCDTEEESD